ncbi:MAG: ABC-type transport auxiliary lipoprotein family protein [Deltaproteobacteria bacterium]
MRLLLLCLHKRFGSLGLVLMISSLLIAGCATSGKPQYNVEKYLLSYPAPSWNQPDKLPAAVKFNRFSISAAYNSTGMIFRNDAYSLDSFNYSRWAVNPADMIGDSLLGDMRASGLFRAVFSRYDAEDGRFVISGGVEEFYLRIDKSNKTAVVGIAISLQDLREKETGKRMMYQKKYLREELLQNASPLGYCQAASQAMQTLSREIIGDVYAAVKAAAE